MHQHTFFSTGGSTVPKKLGGEGGRGGGGGPDREKGEGGAAG